MAVSYNTKHYAFIRLKRATATLKPALFSWVSFVGSDIDTAVGSRLSNGVVTEHLHPVLIKYLALHSPCEVNPDFPP